MEIIKGGNIEKEQSKDVNREFAARKNNNFETFTTKEVDGKWLENCVIGKVR